MFYNVITISIFRRFSLTNRINYPDTNTTKSESQNTAFFPVINIMQQSCLVAIVLCRQKGFFGVVTVV